MFDVSDIPVKMSDKSALSAFCIFVILSLRDEGLVYLIISQSRVVDMDACSSLRAAPPTIWRSTNF
jgi:hypothetical protein